MSAALLKVTSFFMPQLLSYKLSKISLKNIFHGRKLNIQMNKNENDAIENAADKFSLIWLSSICKALIAILVKIKVAG